MEVEDKRETQTGPDSELDAARVDFLHDAVEALLRTLLGGHASCKAVDDHLSAHHFDGNDPNASRACPETQSETDCSILGLRCLYLIYFLDGRHFHEYAIYAYVTEYSILFPHF